MEAVKLLFQASDDPLVVLKKAVENDLPTIKPLLRVGIDINSPLPGCPQHVTALQRAIRLGYLSLAHALLDNGATATLKSDQGETLLHTLAQNLAY